MNFEFGSINIDDLALRPAYNLESSLGHIRFRAGKNIDLLVTHNGKVFLECYKNGKQHTYSGECSEAEINMLEQIYCGGDRHGA